MVDGEIGLGGAGVKAAEENREMCTVGGFYGGGTVRYNKGTILGGLYSMEPVWLGDRILGRY